MQSGQRDSLRRVGLRGPLFAVGNSKTHGKGIMK